MPKGEQDLIKFLVLEIIANFEDTLGSKMITQVLSIFIIFGKKRHEVFIRSEKFENFSSFVHKIN